MITWYSVNSNQQTCRIKYNLKKNETGKKVRGREREKAFLGEDSWKGKA
jgi:hypothetical protein